MKIEKKESRLLLIGPFPPPVGGVAEIFKILAEGGLANHFDLHKINIAFRKQSDLTKGSFTFRRAFIALLHCLWLVWCMISFRPNVVYLSFSPTRWAGLRDALFVAITYKMGARVVIRLDNNLLHEFFMNSSPRVKRRIGKTFERASSVHVQSEIIRRNLRDLVPDEKIRIIRVGINTDFINSIRLEREKNFSSNKILYMGWMILGKGVIDIIDAFDLIAGDFPKSELVLAGPWIKKTDKRVIESRLDLSPFRNRITVTGAIYGKERIKALSEAFVIVTMSVLKEGQPIILTEALGIGVPIISSNYGSLSTVLKHGSGCFFVPEHGSAEMANYLKMLFQDNVLYQNMCNHNLKLFNDHFTHHTFVDLITQDFLRVLQ